MAHFSTPTIHSVSDIKASAHDYETPDRDFTSLRLTFFDTSGEEVVLSAYFEAEDSARAHQIAAAINKAPAPVAEVQS